MGLMRRITELREKQIKAHAEPFLDEGEEVLIWARTRDPQTKRRGLVYLTPRQCIVQWSGSAVSPGAILWQNIHSWGVNDTAESGPVLAIETSMQTALCEILVETEGMVANAQALIQKFAELAPTPRGPLSDVGLAGSFEATTETNVTRERKSLASQTKRIAVTVIGVVLVLAGAVLLVVPGPGILVVLAGLAVLASEYDWAQDILHWARHRYQQTRRKLDARRRQAGRPRGR